jgi:hypothetical protein
MLQREADGKCRLCQQFDETVEHTILACSILAKEQYIQRHDSVCGQLHINICKETGVKLDNEHWYKNAPKLVKSPEGKITILWNPQVQNRQNIPNNKLDIIICDNEKRRTSMLIDVSISRDRNVIKKEADKIPKYKIQKKGECGTVKNKSYTNNRRGNWDHFKTIKKISE